MTDSTEISPLVTLPVRLMVGNTPMAARVIMLSGLALKLAVLREVPQVPRVRIEFDHEDERLGSLQLQGMVTGRDEGVVSITLERLMVAGSRGVVETLLAAWFPAVPRRDDCYQPMMRGFGYELRKAIVSGRAGGVSEEPSASTPAEHDPAKDTLQGFPSSAVKSALVESAVSRPTVQTPPSPPPPPPAKAQPVRSPSRLRSALPLQLARTGSRLLENTQPACLYLDCAVEGVGSGSGYGRAVIYRLATGKRLAFIAAKGARPGFGAKVELITDLTQGGVVSTGRVTASVAWVAPDPDMSTLTLMAVRLAPSNQPSMLGIWDNACEIALQQAHTGGAATIVPLWPLLDGLDL